MAVNCSAGLSEGRSPSELKATAIPWQCQTIGLMELTAGLEKTGESLH